MSAIRNVEPVVRLCAVISQDTSYIDHAIERLVDLWGDVAERSSPIGFDPGGFYENKMGANLQKVLVGFETFEDPADLTAWKLRTNGIEVEFAGHVSASVERPINLDAGYLSQAKLVLATVKDRDHRIYLRDGIFAEVTMNYTAKRWQTHRWTYPSYRDEEAAKFATACRTRLREHIQQHGLARRA